VGYTIIEVISTCPTNWGLTPVDALEWMRENMLPYYPLGTYRDVKAEGFANVAEAAAARALRLAGDDAEPAAPAADTKGGEAS